MFDELVQHKSPSNKVEQTELQFQCSQELTGGLISEELNSCP